MIGHRFKSQRPHLIPKAVVVVVVYFSGFSPLSTIECTCPGLCLSIVVAGGPHRSRLGFVVVTEIVLHICCNNTVDQNPETNSQQIGVENTCGHRFDSLGPHLIPKAVVILFPRFQPSQHRKVQLTGLMPSDCCRGGPTQIISRIRRALGLCTRDVDAWIESPLHARMH